MTAVTDVIDELKKRASQGITVVGPTQLAGEVTVQSSKNSTMKLIVAAVAVPGKYLLKRFPYILDPFELLSIIEFLGGKVVLHDDRSVYIDTTTIENKDIPYTVTRLTTSAFGFAGALLGRFGAVSMGKPGGDALGARPVDLHCDGFRALGAEVNETAEALNATWGNIEPNKRFVLRMPATGVTVNFVSAVVAGRTSAYLENAALDGDMQAMYTFLRELNVEVETRDGVLYIDATNMRNVENTTEFTCWPDRNDAFTWIAYGALSEKGIRICNVKQDDITAALSVVRSLGISVEEVSTTEIVVKAPTKKSTIDTVQVVAGLGKQFHSDWAPLLEVVLTQFNGRSRIIETLFSDRVRQAEILEQMGATITYEGGKVPEGIDLHFKTDPETARYIIDIDGPSQLMAVSTNVGNDVRACAAAILAASQASGESVLSDVGALYRGYENYIERLRSVGVVIAS